MDERKAPGPKPKPKWWSRPAARPGDDRPTAAEEETPATAEESPGAVDGTAGQDDARRTGAPVAGEETTGPGGEPEDAVPPARPLHEPDPYSTPPYGGPGPWAPAPPVQHPVPTPAHGTPVPPGATPGHGTQVPPGATPAHGTHLPPGATPAHGTAVPPGATPGHDAPVQGATPGHGTPVPQGATAGHGAPVPQGAPAGHGVPVPPGANPEHGAPVPPGATPGHGTHLPPGATPGHGTAVPPGATPGHDAPVQGATPGHGTPVPQGATAGHGVPIPPGATPGRGTHLPPGAAPGHGAPPAPGGAAVPPQGVPAGMPHAGMTPPHGTQVPPSPAESAAPSAAQWRQYDPWGAPPSPPSPRTVSRRRGWIAVLLIALVAGCLGGAIGGYLEHDRANGGGDVKLPQAPVDSRPRAPGSIAGIAARALPGVVTIHVRGGSAEGTGTGFVLDDDGHILTNNHVVEPAGTGGEITVTFNGGHTAGARVIGRDAGYDLAVIKVEGVSGLRPLPLGNSDSVRVGDPVVAIGAPFDLEGTVTSGIISAKERPITAGGEKGDGSDVSYVDALQTDAPINPGNSGGPLVDGKARVIGINSAIRAADDGSELGSQGGSIGLGFAIPINQGKRVAEELINTGKATHPVIGVTLDMEYQGDGARVNTKGVGGPPVKPGGPGDEAGIEAGDVITAVDGVRVHSAQELIVKIRSHRPGDRLELTLKRDGDKRSVELSLGSASSEG
ncbi:trypsin-like peptidase domain-containing protein [Streptomyces sp. NPDC048636]|uniref:S1C family serine protease n=1 Tax=Streptomyces sp. NPDC048636 TaxID=3155762 RepID=UPI003428186D